MKRLELNIKCCTKCPFLDDHTCRGSCEDGIAHYTEGGIYSTIDIPNAIKNNTVPEWCPLPDTDKIKDHNCKDHMTAPNHPHSSCTCCYICSVCGKTGCKYCGEK